MTIQICICYLLVINAAAFLAFGIDKRRARHERWRIRESTLLGLAFLGGAAGAWAGMGVFHHKVRKPPFRFGVPLMLLAQAALLVWLWVKGGAIG